jgi:DeoR family transcriptional regulator, fructose operon transcriptional repressor
MLAEERRAKIRELLSHKSTITISELVMAFGTSEMTIRRDLDELEARGVCQRIYGGAMSLRVMEYPNSVYPTFASREQAQSREKTAIAQAGVSLVQPGDTIAIDSGTTAAYLAHALRTSSSITVISNSLGVLSQLYDIPSINLVSPGGTLSLENMNSGGGDLSFVGPITNTTLRSFRPNKAFLGTSGITIKDGISNLGLFQAEIKRTLIDISEEVILITDHTKFGMASGFLVAGIQRFHKVITDILAPPKDVEMLRALGVEVILVEPAHDPIVMNQSTFVFQESKSHLEVVSEKSNFGKHYPEKE